MQAQDAARDRMVQRAHEAAGVARGPLTVRTVIANYVEYLEAHGKTASDVRHRAAAHIDPVLGDVEIGSLTADMLRKWQLTLAKTPARLRTERGQPQQYREFDSSNAEAVRQRRASANKVLTMLKAALNRAFHDGKIPSDAAWRRVKPFKNVERARVRFLTLAEAKRLINACDPEFRPLVQAALASGCRYGELCRIAVADFNPDAGTVAIHTSKSSKSRHVILTAEGSALFARLAAGRGGAEPLLRRNNGDVFGKSYQGRPMAEACRRAKLKPAISFHGLRHTWASHAVMNAFRSWSWRRISVIATPRCARRTTRIWPRAMRSIKYARARRNSASNPATWRVCDEPEPPKAISARDAPANHTQRAGGSRARPAGARRVQLHRYPMGGGGGGKYESECRPASAARRA
jgi:integrase